MSGPTFRELFYVITKPGFQDCGDCGEDREEKVRPLMRTGQELLGFLKAAILKL